jgi:alanine racemase
VIVKGIYAPIRGRISMDLTLIDVTDIPGVAVGDEAILLGSQGSLNVDAQRHAILADTIPYEILCNISKRVPRKYTD